MGLIIATLRSALFTLVFYLGSIPLVLFAFLTLPFSDAATRRAVKAWANFHYVCTRFILGIKVKVTGTLPDGPALYAIKHESMFETIDMLRLFHWPVVVAKQELASIPFWGRIARQHGMIFIDRAGGASTLREMMRTVRAYVQQQRSIVIFPEGTRAAHGTRPRLQSGFAGLYKIAGLPVVPIAMNSGKLITKGHFAKRAGTVHFLIGETIPPGLPRAEMEERVHQAINMLNDDG
jgi:1-acyl-sn-glycerol-3-phosphate acyltransferase